MIARTTFPIIIIATLSFLHNTALGYDDKNSHPEITRKSISSKNTNLNKYLANNLGFKDGIETQFPSGSNSTIRILLQQGSSDEDSPPCRASNHFHDPLKEWGQSGMSDEPLWLDAKCLFWKPIYSNITWATGYLSTPPGGPKQKFSSNPDYASINWDMARDHYYKALTSKANLQPPFPAGRDFHFAKTFHSLGQVLHLLQDMAVPAHVRNDFTSHIAFNGITSSDFVRWFGNHYEYYVQTHTDAITSIPDQAVQYPFFNNARLTDFWDTKTYKGNIPSSSNTIGLSEFTNANYLSDSTIPYSIRTLKHIYTYPKIDTPNIQLCIDYEPGSTDKRAYLSRKDRGDCPPITVERTADHFAALSFWNDFSVRTIIDSVLNQDPTFLATFVSLDDNVHKTYAHDIIPRAVGYSAGLLNYFFRGDIRLEHTTSPTPGYVIANKTAEDMDGGFMIFYDNRKDERIQLHSWALSIKADSKSGIFDITPPSDAKEPGKYILVFRGKMGNEDGAVAGYVFSRALEITPPDQFIYSLIDGNGADPYFRSIRAKVRNASPAEQMQNGTIQALAKYKSDINDADFIYSMSDPQPIDLSSNTPMEIEFNFYNDPIPVDVTDLYLEIIFTGTIGNEANAIASGIKDISEPTPIGIFNNMDRICINGQWYVTNSPEAYNALPDQDKWWDCWPHDLENVYFKVSSVTAPSDALPTNYTFATSNIEPGTLYQMVILSDYEFVYSDYGTMVPQDANDIFVHNKTTKKAAAQGSGVRNQREHSNDPSFCSTYKAGTPCTVTRTSVFYKFRGVEMWGPGSFIVDGVSYPNFTDPGYIPCSWDSLK